MAIKVSPHNALVIIGIAVLGILALKALSRTGLANVPVLGQLVKTGAAA